MARQEINDDNKCAYCLQRMKMLFDDYKSSSEEEQKYTSFIFSIGFVTIITIFTTIHKYFDIKLKSLFICLLFISILTFIINEIWKMLMNIHIWRFQNTLWTRNSKGEITLDELEIEKSKYAVALFSKYEKFYFPIFWISLISGLMSSFVLFLKCLYLIYST